MEKIDESIFEFLSNHPLSSSKEIFDGIATDKGYATIKRTLNHLIELDFLVVSGNGKGTKYKLSNSFIINRPIRIDTYFEKEIDEAFDANEIQRAIKAESDLYERDTEMLSAIVKYRGYMWT